MNRLTGDITCSIDSIMGKPIIGKKTVFFRNDDVGLHSGQDVPTELAAVTNIFAEEGVPICHAVVPGAVNWKTVEWLLGMKSRHPGIISIGQHGYRHIKNSGNGSGEFAGRSYGDQRRDIETGHGIMREYFGKALSPWFAPPWIRYDGNTKKICDSLGFEVFSGGLSPKLRARAFNALGRVLNLNRLGPKEVSYHRRRNFTQRGFRVREISVSVDVVEDYGMRRVKPLFSILRRFRQCRMHYDVIGVMLHHWVFDSRDKLRAMRDLLQEIKADPGIGFLLLEDIGDVNQKG